MSIIAPVGFIHFVQSRSQAAAACSAQFVNFGVRFSHMAFGRNAYNT